MNLLFTETASDGTGDEEEQIMNKDPLDEEEWENLAMEICERQVGKEKYNKRLEKYKKVSIGWYFRFIWRSEYILLLCTNFSLNI